MPVSGTPGKLRPCFIHEFGPAKKDFSISDCFMLRIFRGSIDVLYSFNIIVRSDCCLLLRQYVFTYFVIYRENEPCVTRLLSALLH